MTFMPITCRSISIDFRIQIDVLSSILKKNRYSADTCYIGSLNVVIGRFAEPIILHSFRLRFIAEFQNI